MNRNEYMKELEQALKRLPKAEREEALSYYNEYFDDAGPEREAEVMEELGDAKGIATQIVKEVALKRLAEPKPEKAARNGLSTLWIVLLALCAAPIGLPLLLAVVIFGLAMVIMVFHICGPSYLRSGFCGCWNRERCGGNLFPSSPDGQRNLYSGHGLGRIRSGTAFDLCRLRKL